MTTIEGFKVYLNREYARFEILLRGFTLRAESLERLREELKEHLILHSSQGKECVKVDRPWSSRLDGGEQKKHPFYLPLDLRQAPQVTRAFRADRSTYKISHEGKVELDSSGDLYERNPEIEGQLVALKEQYEKESFQWNERVRYFQGRWIELMKDLKPAELPVVAESLDVAKELLLPKEEFLKDPQD